MEEWHIHLTEHAEKGLTCSQHTIKITDCILSIPLVIKINKCEARWFPSNPNTASTNKILKEKNVSEIISIKQHTWLQRENTCT
jgi:hypothetical protein